jgi:hypothetical protein
MRDVRRFAVLSVLALLLAAAAVAVMPKANASPKPPAPPAPVQLNYACALKSNGLLRYVTSTAKCARTETPVTIASGPHYVCVDRLGLVYLTAAPGNCTAARHLTALTLPPSAGPAYFCALPVIGTLTYTSTGKCLPLIQFPVVVPVPAVTHTAPILSNIETTPLTYEGGTGAVQVTASLTVFSADATTLAGATVTISSGLESGDSLGFNNQNSIGITGSYSASTGVLSLTGTSSLANYQTALRLVTYHDSGTAAGTRTISFQVNDGAPANSLSNVLSRTVDVLAGSVTVTNPGPQSSDTSDPVSLQMTGTDSAALPLTWSATGLPDEVDNILTIEPATGLISGITPTNGTYTVTVTASDGTDSDTVTFTWTVTGPDMKP